jgi:hypothetical protein
MRIVAQFSALLLAVSALTSAPASAATYKSANFTFGVFGGNTNQKSPFQGVVAPYPAGGSFTGSLVFDADLVPGPASGVQNVFFSSFPDIAAIPSAVALNLPLGSLPAFTLNDAQVQFSTQYAAIQYNNGNFNGLFYISDFTYLGNPYELQIQGGSLSIVPIVNGNPTFNPVVNGYVNFSLTDVQPYALPVAETPLPAALPLFAAGTGLIGLLGWRRKRKPQMIAA